MKSQNILLPPGKHRAERAPGASARTTSILGRFSITRNHVGRHRVPAHETVRHPDYRQFSERSEKSWLVDDSLNVSTRKPLMDGAAVQSWSGLDLGPLQAVVHPSNTSRVFCFDRSYRDQSGGRIARYVFLTDEQLENIRTARTNGDLLSKALIEQGGLVLESESPGADRNQVVGEHHPMPGVRPRGNVTNIEGEVRDASLAGETLLSIKPAHYQSLTVQDLHGQHGTMVEANSEYITPQDPWAGAPIGSMPLHATSPPAMTGVR